MARKRVLKYSSNLPIEHITHREAFDLVTQQKAEWIEKYTCISMIDEKVVPRGINQTHFDDVWHLQPSANVPVWQVREGALAGL